MVHCNPAPPHPPPGEVYNVICMGRPYVEGYPMGYVVVGVYLVLAIGALVLSRKIHRQRDRYDQ